MVVAHSILLIHHRDIRSPFSAAVPHYLAQNLAESHTVHVLCPVRQVPDDGQWVESDVVFHGINKGNRRVVSGVLFLLFSTLYAAILGFRHRYNTVYGFQRTLFQAWIANITGGSKFVAGLQVVPVRQKTDFISHSSNRINLTEVLSYRLRLAYAKIVKYLLTKPTEIICLTEGIKNLTQEEYGVDLSDAHIVGMGVDTKLFRNRQSTPTFHEPLTITYVGSLGPTRGIKHVLEAVSKSEYDINLRIVGDGKKRYMQCMQSRADELGISHSVEWLGRIPHKQVPDELAETDIAISPLDNIESYRISFPTKLLEYMAAGVVVFGTNIRPHKELIEGGVNGVLYEGTPHSLCNALEQCIEGDIEKRSIERAARETAKSYDWESVVKRHEKLIFK